MPAIDDTSLHYTPTNERPRFLFVFLFVCLFLSISLPLANSLPFLARIITLVPLLVLELLLAFWVFHFGERAFNAKSKKNQENIKESLKKVDLRNYMT